MAAEVPNIAKGRLAHYAAQHGVGNAALRWVLLQATGLEAISVLRDADTLAAMVAGTTNELTSTGYARVTAGSVTVTVDDTNDRVDLDCADPSFTVTASVQDVGAAVLVLDPDTTGGTDADLIPIFVDVLAAAFTPTVNVAFTYQVAAAGFARAA